MTLEQAERLLAHAAELPYSGMNYTGPEQVAASQLLLDTAEVLLLRSHDSEGGNDELLWASRSEKALLTALASLHGLLRFIPAQWEGHLLRRGWQERCVWRDMFRPSLEDIPASSPPCLLTSDEAEAASALTRSLAYQTRGFTGQTPAWFRAWLSGEEVRDAAVLVERAPGGSLAGLVCTGIYGDDSPKGPVAWVREAAVRRDLQGRGIGKRLICQALSCEKERGAVRAFLAVDAQNPAAHLYSTLGFQMQSSAPEIVMER